MSVRFRAVERVNPRDLTLPNKYYPQIINGDDVTFDELAELISKVSSLNYGDVLGALGTLIEVIQMQLKHGRQVRLHTLGTLFLTLSGEGTDTPEDLTNSSIARTNIRFRPGKRLKRTIGILDFEKVSNGENGKTNTTN